MNYFYYWIAFVVLCITSLFSVNQALARYHHDIIEVDIISDERGQLKKHRVGSRNDKIKKNYIVARDNEAYRIRIRNTSDRRVGVVIAVDGRNIISGLNSYSGSIGRMNILNPHQTGEYSGWRRNRSHVNRFFFTNISNSYSVAWEDFSNLGLISVTAFNEYCKKSGSYMNHRRRNSKRDGLSPRPKHKQRRVATGYGENEWSPGRIVSFTPQQEPVFKEVIKYQNSSTLCRYGVVRCRPKFHTSFDNFNSKQNWNDVFPPPSLWQRRNYWSPQ